MKIIITIEIQENGNSAPLDFSKLDAQLDKLESINVSASTIDEETSAIFNQTGDN